MLVRTTALRSSPSTLKREIKRQREKNVVVYLFLDHVCVRVHVVVFVMYCLCDVCLCRYSTGPRRYPSALQRPVRGHRGPWSRENRGGGRFLRRGVVAVSDAAAAVAAVSADFYCAQGGGGVFVATHDRNESQHPYHIR